MKYSTLNSVLFFVGLLSQSLTQENLPSAQDILEKVPELGNVPGLSNFNTSTLPIDEAKTVFKQKCEKNGGPEAFEKAKNGQEQMMQCMKSLINVTELQTEMEEAKPKGELDEVFKKYCRKSPIFKDCVMNFTNSVEPCLEEKERESKKIIMNITESLLGFICFKEGDRIALFISAGGPECFQDKQQAIQDCMNATYGGYVPVPNPNNSGLPSLDSLPALVFGDKECRDISNLQTCIVKELEKCSDTTPANIVESIFNFIKRVTPCDNLLSSKADPLVKQDSSMSCVFVSSFFTVIALVLTIRVV